MSAGDISWAMAGPAVTPIDALFEQVLTTHQRPILRLCYRLLGNLADAQDAAQEVFLRVYRHRAKLDPARNPSPWLYQIAINICRDRRRAARPSVEVESLNLRASGTPESATADGEMQRLLLQGLDTLAERERQALVLRDLEGLSSAEAAALLGSTESTVRSQASIARAKLRDWMTQQLRGRQ